MTEHGNITLEMVKISVVFSFKNEEEVLPELIRRTRAVFEKEMEENRLQEYELIFVNDNSSDRSKEVLMAAAQEKGDIRLINMSGTFGVSPCVMAGLEHASGDAVIYMDADLQDPPEVLPRLIQAWRETGADVVHTRRTSRAGESFMKLLLTKLGYWILHSVTQVKLPMETGDFKLLSRRVVKELIKLREKRPFMRGLVCWVGFRQVSIEYQRDARGAGKTKFFILSPKVIGNFLMSALISFSDVPLHLSLVAGLLSALITIIILVHVLIEKFLRHNLPGWTALMVAILFVGSMQLISNAILGFYISSIFLETKQRPNYIIESTYGFDSEKGPGPQAPQGMIKE